MAKRINLVTPVRTALEAMGFSTVLVVSAVNAALGELDKTKEEHKTGAGRVTKLSYAVSETVSIGYKGKRTFPLDFDAWHSAIERADKIAQFDTVAIPAQFTPWLQKMKAPAPAAAPATNGNGEHKADGNGAAPAADPKAALAALASRGTKPVAA